MNNQSEAASVLCMPIGAKLWPSTSIQPTISAFVNTIALRTANLIQDFIRGNRQAALHSAMFNYTLLVIGGTDKNKKLTIIKLMQTGINSN